MPHGISSESSWRRSRVTVAVPQPAAGADWTLTIPAGHVYRLLSLYAVLASSAVVATRVARLAFTDGARTFLDLSAGASQVASLTRRYAWLPSVGPSAVGSGILSALPDVALGAGWTIASLTDAIDVGDQWSAIVLNVLDTTARGGPADLDDIPDMVIELVGPPSG